MKFTPNKSFGQHFLTSEKVVTDIIDDDQNSPFAIEKILEIGPGPGVLTNHLIKKDKPFKVIEIDDQFIAHLSDLVGSENILQGDALRFNYNEILQGEDESYWLVSNLPYNIAGPLMAKLFCHPKIALMTLMMQKEMGEKMLKTSPKFKMNSLGLLSHCYFDVKKLCLVPPGSFSPPPKVDSIVLSFRKKHNPDIDFKIYPKLEAFGRNFFAHPRKQLMKNLKESYPHKDWKQAFEKSQVSLTIRAEACTHEQVLRLFNFWYEDGNN
ncbi:MAG: 16S rRNA (adenine(1518)-N(6)/adenine(1519)-N(6))-dimethyltransferase RsmA [Bacteriovoracaceae bacterium]